MGHAPDTSVVMARVARLRRRPWTPREDRILTNLTSPPKRGRMVIDWLAVERALPKRTRDAIAKRREDLSLARGGWTEAESLIVQRKWNESSRRSLLALLPGRSWRAIMDHATEKLGFKTVPQGWVTVNQAAIEMGYHPDTMRLLLARHGVTTMNHSTTTKNRMGSRVWSIVERDAALTAVEADLACETISAASARLKVTRDTLSRWMIDAGHAPDGKWFRLPPETYNLVARAHGHRKGCESLTASARRHGVAYQTLGQWLRADGIVRAGALLSEVWIDPAKADAVVNARRSRDVGCAS